ncbi:MAG: hypothetical protein BZ138_06610 [Methanosphaera sp. rholeuAM270]|nr:MAG: hypothetical protein BZ138_06610 [Methanosphaera sp. rholeuAM270]
MSDNNEGKYYIYPTGWEGIDYETLLEECDDDYERFFPANVVYSEEDAFARVNYLRETEMQPDEAVYILFPDKHYEEH